MHRFQHLGKERTRAKEKVREKIESKAGSNGLLIFRRRANGISYACVFSPGNVLPPIASSHMPVRIRNPTVQRVAQSTRRLIIRRRLTDSTLRPQTVQMVCSRLH